MTSRSLSVSKWLGALLPLSLAFTPITAGAADYTLKYGVVTQGDMQHLYGLKLKEVVEKATNGRVEVKVFSGGQLGSPAAHIEGLQLGTIEGYSNPADFFCGRRRALRNVQHSLLVQGSRSRQPHAARSGAEGFHSRHGDVERPRRRQRRRSGGVALFRQQPDPPLADFNGKKLRVNATPAERARMQAFGATAVPMGLAEMITSLQNGVIDGTMSGISIYVNFNLQTVSKTITETNDTLLVSFGAISKAWLDKLPADLRKTVVDEARGLQDWAMKQSQDEKVALRAKWMERGGEIVTLPADDMAELQKRLKPIGAEVTKSDPKMKAFYDKVVATAAKY